MRTFIEQLGKISPGAQYRVVVFELNADKHALATRARQRPRHQPVAARSETGSRIVCSANGLQPDGQNDNGWNQGLLFLNPAQVWEQPPYYAMQMLARQGLPRCVRAEVQDATGALDVTALTDLAGKILAVQVVNSQAEPISSQLLLDGFHPRHAEAEVTTLSGPLEAVNTAVAPMRIVPSRHAWHHGLHEGVTEYTFPGHSFTILRFQ